MNRKQHGVVYTPPSIVKFITDFLLHDVTNEVKLIDPACGTGNFLVYAAHSLSEKLNKPLDKVVAENIFGLDRDEDALKQCRMRLGSPCNIFQGNSIDPNFISSHLGKYDIVVGNPPYVRIQNLPEEDKKLLKHWTFSEGNTDLYVSFIEMAFKLIHDTGKVGYITPNSFIKNRSQKRFTNFLIKERLLSHLIDFKHHKVFPDASTYCSIFFGDKKPKSHLAVAWPTTTGICCDVKKYEDITSTTLSLSSQEQKRISHLQTRGKKLKDICKISVGLATLADSVFYIDNYVDHEHAIYTKGKYLEKSLLKPCIKVGKLKNESDLNKKGWIIFPYENGKPISEYKLKSEYPGIYEYLSDHKDVLLSRDKGKIRYEWFAYGRSQGLNTLWGEKLLIPPIAKSPKLIHSKDENLLFISGYCIHKPQGTSLEHIKEELLKPEFAEYVQLISKDYQGGWKSCAKNMIQDYSICMN